MLGSDTVRTGVLLATNRRLVFYANKMMGYDLESFPYENISSFEQSTGAMGGKVSFFATGNKVEIKWINDGDVIALAQTVRSRMGKGAQQPVATPAGDDPIDQVRRLAQLRDDGILTEEEFQAKKTQILGL